MNETSTCLSRKILDRRGPSACGRWMDMSNDSPMDLDDGLAPKWAEGRSGDSKPRRTGTGEVGLLALLALRRLD